MAEIPVYESQLEPAKSGDVPRASSRPFEEIGAAVAKLGVTAKDVVEDFELRQNQAEYLAAENALIEDYNQFALDAENNRRGAAALPDAKTGKAGVFDDYKQRSRRLIGDFSNRFTGAFKDEALARLKRKAMEYGNTVAKFQQGEQRSVLLDRSNVNIGLAGTEFTRRTQSPDFGAADIAAYADKVRAALIMGKGTTAVEADVAKQLSAYVPRAIRALSATDAERAKALMEDPAFAAHFTDPAEVEATKAQIEKDGEDQTVARVVDDISILTYPEKLAALGNIKDDKVKARAATIVEAEQNRFERIRNAREVETFDLFARGIEENAYRSEADVAREFKAIDGLAIPSHAKASLKSMVNGRQNSYQQATYEAYFQQARVGKLDVKALEDSGLNPSQRESIVKFFENKEEKAVVEEYFNRFNSGRAGWKDADRERFVDDAMSDTRMDISSRMAVAAWAKPDAKAIADQEKRERLGNYLAWEQRILSGQTTSADELRKAWRDGSLITENYNALASLLEINKANPDLQGAWTEIDLTYRDLWADDVEQKAVFKQALNAEVAAEQKRRGERLTSEDVKKIADRLATPIIKEKGWFTDDVIYPYRDGFGAVLP